MSNQIVKKPRAVVAAAYYTFKLPNGKHGKGYEGLERLQKDGDYFNGFWKDV